MCLHGSKASKMSTGKLPPHAYLAGPTVFFADALAQGAYLASLCKSHGMEGVFPPATMPPPAGKGRGTALQVFEFNVTLLRKCDLLIADLSPFRGPHADDGTAFEVGVAYALKKPIFAYSSDLRSLVDRIGAVKAPDGKTRDKAGLEIENFDQPHNLMLIGATNIWASAEEAISAAGRFMSSRDTT